MVDQIKKTKNKNKEKRKIEVHFSHGKPYRKMKKKKVQHIIHFKNRRVIAEEDS